MSQNPRCNGWTLAEQAGDRGPDRMQRHATRLRHLLTLRNQVRTAEVNLRL